MVAPTISIVPDTFGKRGRRRDAGSAERRSAWVGTVAARGRGVVACGDAVPAARVEKRFCGGGPPPEAKELVAAICLSVLQDEKHVTAVLNQAWVETWQGWEALRADGSDAVALDVAQRLLQIAGANVPVKMMTNTRRLPELSARGLHLKVAASHGVNNCLIDALLLGLVANGLTARDYTLAERKALCASCREDLRARHGVPRGVYLDGHRETPRILDFFLRRLWKLDISVRVFFYDCMDHGELGMASAELSHVDFTWGDRVVYERQTLHVYNHTDPVGKAITLMPWLVP